MPYLVLEKEGPSLEVLFNRLNKNFSIDTTLKIGLNILGLLQKMHKKGYLHCYLDLTNIVTGKELSEN